MADATTLAKDYKWLVAFILFGALLAAAGGALFNSTASAATSPTFGAAGSYSVLGGQAATCTGVTTTTGDVGVTPGTSITGFPDPCVAGPPGTTHSNDASAIAAQADNLSLFDALNAGENADANCIGGILPDGTDLTGLSPLTPGLYCSAGSFMLTGNLALEGEGVWIFKTVSTLITSSGSSVTGGNPCDVWWRVGSSVTLGTDTSFIGNILALNGVNAMNNGATLDGRLLVQAAGTVTLDSNTITTADCAEEEESTPTSTPPFVPDSGDSSTSTPVPTATRVATPSASPAASPTTRPAAPSQGQPPQVVPPQTGDAGLLRASQLLR